MSVPKKKEIELFRDESGSIHAESKTNDQLRKSDDSLIVIQNEKEEKKKKRKKSKNRKINKEENKANDDEKEKPKKRKSSSKIKNESSRKFSVKESELKKPKISEEITVKENIENKNIEIEMDENITMNRCSRYLVFVFILVINAGINLDIGTFPAITEELEKDLKIKSFQIGLLGTLTYTGNVAGTYYMI
jgi:hypothetical protein